MKVRIGKMAYKKNAKETPKTCLQCAYRPHWTCENRESKNYDEMIPSTNPICKKFQDKNEGKR